MEATYLMDTATAQVVADSIQYGLSTLSWAIFCGFLLQAMFNR